MFTSAYSITPGTIFFIQKKSAGLLRDSRKPRIFLGKNYLFWWMKESETTG